MDTRDPIEHSGQMEYNLFAVKTVSDGFLRVDAYTGAVAVRGHQRRLYPGLDGQRFRLSSLYVLRTQAFPG